MTLRDRRFLIALFALSVLCLFFLLPEIAHAVGPSKPDVFNQTPDVSKANSAFTKLVDYAAWFAYLMGGAAIAIGLGLVSPIVGNPDQGKKAIKGGAVVVLVAGVLHILLSFLGNLTQ